MAEAMKQSVATMLKGIERYNPDNLSTLERYVVTQARENAYDLEANLAVLKLYQFNPHLFNIEITSQILLKALTNFPHTDFILCKCLLTEQRLSEEPISQIMFLAHILEQCDFQIFWKRIETMPDMTSRITGFLDSIRKFVCHVVGITYQTIDRTHLSQLLGDINDSTMKHWIKKYGWREDGNLVFISNQEENIKTKNINEKIEFDHVAAIMKSCR
ncbi:PREDICTED: eukaryotic translation initiation factor 3 subunit K [Nicrophorus vespilloides]|uniref:Eukaryotic translation initiation factor 3 subunit K n=1 Tax=Nicrophorus vespilloides TaxID=110193 RepID=A0ABM1MFZ3_NICVS|nr:PREDICTED: eukaryotic translation initiation factor 3 subunit K [Nicrophorus vespilloides]